MKRRGFLASFLVPLLPSIGVAEHHHRWVEGPFYLTVASTWEEPGYEPPRGLIKVEYCADCGILRIPMDLAGPCAHKDFLTSCTGVTTK